MPNVIFFFCLLSLSIQTLYSQTADQAGFNKTFTSASIQTSSVASSLNAGEKKPMPGKKAFLYSLLLPGLGDLYLNNWDLKKWGNGKYFFASETALWAAFFYMKSYSGWIKQDSRSLAARHAGVDWNAAKPANYSTVIGKFEDIYSYNVTQRRLTGNSMLYAETPDLYWKWDSQGNMKKYDNLRIKSQSAKTYSTYVVYGIVVNHLLSAINTMRTLRIRAKNQTVHFNLMYVNSVTSTDRYHGLALQVSGY